MIDENEIKRKIRVFSNRLSELIEDVCYECDKTNETQAKEIGFAKGNLSKYKASNDAAKLTPRPRVDILMRIADYYGVSTDYLLGYTDCKTSVGTDEKELIRAICDYTGLQEQTICKIKKTKTSTFKRFVINEILQNDELFEELILYYASSFLDLYKSSRYYDLPQSYKFSDFLECNSLKAKKMQAYSLQERLALSREDFYKQFTPNDDSKLTIVLAMAQIFVDKFTTKRKIEESDISMIEEGAAAISCQKMKKEDILKQLEKLLEEINTQEPSDHEPRFNGEYKKPSRQE